MSAADIIVHTLGSGLCDWKSRASLLVPMLLKVSIHRACLVRQIARRDADHLHVRQGEVAVNTHNRGLCVSDPAPELVSGRHRRARVLPILGILS